MGAMILHDAPSITNKTYATLGFTLGEGGYAAWQPVGKKPDLNVNGFWLWMWAPSH